MAHRSCAALSGRGAADRTGGPTRHAQVDRPRAPLVDPRKLVLRSGEAGSHTFDLAEPAFVFGFGDSGVEVVVDLLEAGALGRVARRRAMNALCASIVSAG
ncbi:hypothetical protein [Streptomyces brevispora]|uniref:hypothetical protein n=1 Tax=Streptomyces brevispora TaxID=887462 RepID=UPI0035DABF13